MWNALPGVTFGDFFLNSLKIATLATIGALVSCSMAAFAFAVLPFRGKGLLFALVMATLIIPFQVVLVPNFILYRTLPHPFSDSGNWIGTQEPLWVGAWLGRRLRHLPPPPVLPDHAPRAGRRGARGRREPVGHLPAASTCRWPGRCWRRWPSSPSCGAGTTSSSPLIYLRDLPDYTTTVGLAFFQGQFVGQVAGDDGRRAGQPGADGGAVRHRPAVLRARHRHLRAQGMTRDPEGVNRHARVGRPAALPTDRRPTCATGSQRRAAAGRPGGDRAGADGPLRGQPGDGPPGARPAHRRRASLEIRRGLGTYVRSLAAWSTRLGGFYTLQPGDRAARHDARHAVLEPAPSSPPASASRPRWSSRPGPRRRAVPAPAGRRRAHRGRDELPAGRPLPGPRDGRLHPRSLYDTLTTEYGVRPVRARETFEPVLLAGRRRPSWAAHGATRRCAWSARVRRGGPRHRVLPEHRCGATATATPWSSATDERRRGPVQPSIQHTQGDAMTVERPATRALPLTSDAVREAVTATTAWREASTGGDAIAAALAWRVRRPRTSSTRWPAPRRSSSPAPAPPTTSPTSRPPRCDQRCGLPAVAAPLVGGAAAPGHGARGAASRSHSRSSSCRVRAPRRRPSTSSASCRSAAARPSR